MLQEIKAKHTAIKNKIFSCLSIFIVSYSQNYELSCQKKELTYSSPLSCI
ncbi:hypothetical protein M079_4961 [Bacteroides fragilis str. 3996 N(B) 6]|nr:hypothetical protein M079_4961 [Bacteroides fragilis str. 3996 N(B) 6]